MWEIWVNMSHFNPIRVYYLCTEITGHFNECRSFFQRFTRYAATEYFMSFYFILRDCDKWKYVAWESIETLAKYCQNQSQWYSHQQVFFLYNWKSQTYSFRYPYFPRLHTNLFFTFLIFSRVLFKWIYWSLSIPFCCWPHNLYELYKPILNLYNFLE